MMFHAKLIHILERLWNLCEACNEYENLFISWISHEEGNRNSNRKATPSFQALIKTLLLNFSVWLCGVGICINVRNASVHWPDYSLCICGWRDFHALENVERRCWIFYFMPMLTFTSLPWKHTHWWHKDKRVSEMCIMQMNLPQVRK